MAEQDEKLLEPADGDGVGAEEKAAGKGKIFWIFLIAAALVPALGGAFLAYTKYPQILTAATALGIGVASEDSTEVKEEPIEYKEFLEMENLVINPMGTDGHRFLMVKLGLESDAKVLEDVKKKEMVVRDTLLKVLGRRTVIELSDISQRNSLKEEMRHAINSVTGEVGEIDRIYFTQYVLQ